MVNGSVELVGSEVAGRDGDIGGVMNGVTEIEPVAVLITASALSP